MLSCKFCGGFTVPLLGVMPQSSLGGGDASQNQWDVKAEQDDHEAEPHHSDGQGGSSGSLGRAQQDDILEANSTRLDAPRL